MPETAVFDHYEVLTRDDGSLFELGRGAMGVTYKAFDINLKVPVALKVINATYLNSEVARQRFQREARSAAKIRNPHVASVFHLGMEGDTWFYAMEFIDGETLEGLIKRQGPLTPTLALAITGQVARALNAAAQFGLVHRDIKPANLMLVKDDDELIAKVIDFGLAKATLLVEGEDAATLSMGGFVGTPHFASPEQLEEREIDSRSDIYSLGVTLWYMLAGQAPFAGSMAQVMVQHLSKPPPFEKLAKLPPPVADILRTMLAKDPAERYQTPGELRKAIDAALKNISGMGSSAAVIPKAAEPHEDFATLLESSTPGSTAGNFETNSIIANRYRVAQSCGETNAGRVFRAYDTQRKAEVRLLVLHSEALNDRATMAALEREVEKLGPVKHPNLLGVFGFETVDRGSFVVFEWTEGFSVLDLLKARRELEAGEALQLLAQAAEGADKALSLGLNDLEFGLHQLYIHFPQQAEKEKLLRVPLNTWPAFELKLYPLGATHDFAASLTWAGGQTMVGGSASKSTGGGTEARAQYVQALATVVYEILGGTISPLARRSAGGPVTRYTPLATLSEEGNEVLRRALDPARSFPSVKEFSAALSQFIGSRSTAPTAPPQQPPGSTASVAPPPVRQVPQQPPRSAAPVAPPSARQVPQQPPRSTPPAAPPSARQVPQQPPRSTAPTAPPSARQVPQQPPRSTPPTAPPSVQPSPPSVAPPYYTPPPPRTVPKALIGGVAAIVVAAAGLTIFLLQAPKPSKPATPYPTPTTPSPTPPNPTPPSPTPTPAPPPPPTAPPPTPRVGPTRQEKVNTAIAEADELKKKGDRHQSLDAYLRIAKEYPEFRVGKNRLEEMLNELRDRPSPITFEEFQGLRDQITECAQFDIISAMLLIGDSLRTREPQTAIHWFSVAAGKGNPIGLVNYGQMLKKGQGVDKPDQETAASLFQKAADQGDIAGKFELGVCYLNGQGVTADQKHAVELYLEAANGGDSRAMDELGFCYSQGLGVVKNPNTAFQWFSKSDEKGNLEASANLGVLYINGTGVAKDPKKGAQLFEKGAKAENATCMFFFATALENGFGVSKNPMLATSWYKKAAAAGNQRAIEWCDENKIPYGPEH